jgi:hypothetical protein
VFAAARRSAGFGEDFRALALARRARPLWLRRDTFFTGFRPPQSQATTVARTLCTGRAAGSIGSLSSVGPPKGSVPADV